MFKYNKDFYPTPDHVISMMDIDCRDKVVLEPSAGKGDLVEWLKSTGAKQVLVCEKDTDLAEIAQAKADKFLGYDFLQVQSADVAHIDMIVMNPPFSEGVKHVLYAWEIAPDGCEIISLINYSNIEYKDYGKAGELREIIKSYGLSENLGNCFDTAERQTDVEVGLIKLFKPKAGSTEFDGFFLEEDEVEQQENGIMKFNAVRDAVQRYVAAVQLFDEHQVISSKMSKLTDIFKVGTFTFHIEYNKDIVSRDDFKKELQKKAWAHLFDKMDLKKYVTSGVMKDINKFVENQQSVPFTMKNVYRMFEIIVGTREETFNRSLVEAMDRFTKYTDENRYSVEGWKTNEGHMLNKVFIVPYMVSYSTGTHFSLNHNSNVDYINDLVKVLCSITAKDYNSMPPLYNIVRYENVLYSGEKYIQCFGDREFELKELEEYKKKLYEEGRPVTVVQGRPEYGKWFDWGFFQVRAYKKGTMHLKFKDLKVWELINRKYAAIKGQVLPEKLKI